MPNENTNEEIEEPKGKTKKYLLVTATFVLLAVLSVALLDGLSGGQGRLSFFERLREAREQREQENTEPQEEEQPSEEQPAEEEPKGDDTPVFAEGPLPEKVVSAGDYTFEYEQPYGFLWNYDRTAEIHVPQSYIEKNEPAPVVVMFHGGGGNANQAKTDTGWNDKADKEGFIVVYPEGFNWVPRLWNAGECCGKAMEKGMDDVGFVDEIVRKVESSLNVDKNRIYATGFSNGSMMAYRVACERSDTFAAVAGVSGTMAYDSCNPSRDIPILHVHAKDDPTVLYEGGCGEGDPSFFGEVIGISGCQSGHDHISVAENIADWQQYDSCSKTDKFVNYPYSGSATCTRYFKCTSDHVEVGLCAVNQGGHNWFNADEGGFQTTNYIWDKFFAFYKLNGTGRIKAEFLAK